MKKLLGIVVLGFWLTGCATGTAIKFSDDAYDIIIEKWDAPLTNCLLIFKYKNKSSLALQPSFIFDVSTKDKTISSILLETKDVLEPGQEIVISTGDFPDIDKDLDNIKCKQITNINLKDVKFKNFKFRID